MKLILIGILLISFLACSDQKSRCYECTMVLTKDIYKMPVCGYSNSRSAKDYLQNEYKGNLVINGQTLKNIDCIKIKN